MSGPDPRLGRVAELVASRLGLAFPPERWPDVERGLARAAEELEVPPTVLLDDLLERAWDPRRMAALARQLTVGETYFFRDAAVMAALKERVLPELLQKRRATGRRLRIWSAGCASGEEAYSVAILLDQLLPRDESWQTTILATDVNPAALRKAAAGAFTAWSLRATAPEVRRRYFRETDRNRFELAPAIRATVAFDLLNLADNGYPSLTGGINAIDLILCRNVLMYFGVDQARAVVARLTRALADDGWLVIGPAEGAHGPYPGLAATIVNGVPLYAKAAIPAPVAPVVEARSVPPPPPPRRAAAPTPPRPVPARPAAASDPSELYAGGRFSETVAELERRRGATSPTVEELQLGVRALANLGRLDDAVRWCERALDLAPLDAGAHYLKAVLLSELGQDVDAAGELRRALFLEPDMVVALVAMGWVERRRGRPRAAGRHFAAALTLLRRLEAGAPVPGSDGLTAGRLAEMVSAIARRPPPSQTGSQA